MTNSSTDSLVITGVAGLVGYHLARKLLAQGRHVTGMDKSRNDLVSELERDANFSFFLSDITDLKQVKAAIQGTAYLVYHLAGQPSVWYANKYPADDFAANVTGTLNLLEVLRQAGGGKIVFSSTGDIYGRASPAVEDAIPQPDNFYGLSKLTAENYIRAYAALYNIKYCILRFSLIYGAHLRRNVIFDILKGFREGKIDLFTAQESRFDFIYIDDALAALESAVSAQWENLTLNISSGQGVSVGHMLQKAGELLKRGHGPKISVKEHKKVDKVLDNSLALQLGWKPSYPFDDGLEKLISWWSAENAA